MSDVTERNWTETDESGLLINGEPAVGVRRVLIERYADEDQLGLITTPEWISPKGNFTLGWGGPPNLDVILSSDGCPLAEVPPGRDIVIHRFAIVEESRPYGYRTNPRPFQGMD